VRTKSTRFAILCSVLGAGHVVFALATGHLRPEHVLADGLIAIVPWFGPRAQALTRGGLLLALGGILFDNQRYLIPLRGVIHTGDIQDLDRMLFPAPGGISFPEFFATHHAAAADLFTGFAYGIYVFWLFAAAVVLFFIDERRFQRLCLAFLLTVVAGVLVYLVYPAAPPWYVMSHGPGPADPATAVASAAGAARVDELLGITYFASLYSRNPNVFGAMPSLHVAFPLLVAWTLGGVGPIYRAVTVGFTLLMAFAAIYLGHHWVLDVLAGAVIAILASVAARALTTTDPPRINAAVHFLGKN
jgi:membrane-associated phospholipid phosphatase